MKYLNRLALCSAMVLACSATMVRADDPKPAIFMRASISSVDDVKKLISDLGIPMPGDPQKMIESTFPFLTDGGLQSGKPVGLAVVASEQFKPGNAVIMMFPVVAGRADVAAFTKGGGVAVPGHADMAAMGPENMRRTDNYMLMSGASADLVASVADNFFAADYAAPGRLALVSIDLAAARAAAPTQYKSMWTQLAAAPGAPINPDLAKGFVDKFDHVQLALATGDNALHIQTWAAPTPFAGAKTFPQPVMPAGVVAQVNTAYPDAKSADWIATLVDSMPESKFVDTHTDAAHAPHAKALALKLARVFEADAQSIAVEVKDGKPIFYIVEQYAGDRDLSKEISALADEANAFAKETNDSDGAVTLSTYQNDAGKTVSRIAMQKNGKPNGNMDFIQIGHTAYITAADDDAKHLDAIAGVAPKGEMSALCSGSIDLTACLAAAKASGQMPLPPAMVADMTTAFAGQSITWSAKTTAGADGKGNEVAFDLAVPLPVLKEAAKIAGQMMGGPPPGGPGGGAGGPPPGQMP